MKKVCTILLVLALCFLMNACGNEDKKNHESDANTNPVVSNDNNETEDTEITMDTLLNAPASKESDFFCNEDGAGGYILTQYLGDDEIVVIPDTINGKQVTEISKYTFANDCSVKAIKLSDSVRTISGFAFTQNKNLEIVYCGESLEIIDDSAFQACESLKEIRLNDKLKEIHTLAFSQCTKMQDITIPTSVEMVEGLAFSLMSDSFIIYGASGSPVENYAKTEGIQFKAQ